ncbi:COG2236 Predicted phosphoribosyltransferases [uncultured Caudovirales phage]|uniref:COG2236 Predicted phosphoribosyltransferases n=1 Tax=uncultured Caudovirales phage TaxID=2100421 RepID=A0A6J5KXX5_9CAUD|nr:COG2236 Predicted phosphoribosyltransferases [uncultured Caudovirales phage]
MTDLNFKRHYDWSEVQIAVINLKLKMDFDGWIPDIIVGIANGGVIPATLLAKKFNIPVAAAAVQLRDGNVLEIDYNTVDLAWHGMKVLIVDDINDTGATLQWIKNNWGFDPDSWDCGVRTAVIHTKPKSVFNVTYNAEEVSQATWVVYPWE